MSVLPVFPLGTVLLPGSRLPLQIFEPRYLALLGDLRELEPTDRVFGVVGIRRGREVGEGRATDLYRVGCVARVEAAEIVREAGSPPRYKVVVVGTRRFRLERLVDVARPYPTAEVTLLEDEEPETPAEVRRLGERLVGAFVTYRRAVGAPETHIVGPLERVAGQVMSAMPVGMADQQRVLEAGSVSAQVRAALAVVQRENAIVETFAAVPAPPGQVSPN